MADAWARPYMDADVAEVLVNREQIQARLLELGHQIAAD